MATAAAITPNTDNSDAQLAQLTARVDAIKAAKVDAVADTSALTAVAVRADNQKPQVILTAPGGVRIQIGEVAHQQWSDRLKINKPYYDRMVVEAPELLAQNLNWWLQQTPEERLLRMLKPEGLTIADAKEMAALGTQLRLRGVLGKGYRTIDDADLVAAIVPTLLENGAKLVDFSIDERRMHAKFATEVATMTQLRELYAAKYGLTVEQVRRHTIVDGKDVSWVNEPLATGVTIRHSEVGFASLGAAFFQRVAKCLNDYVDENAVAIRHVGGKNIGAGDDDVRYLSDATQLMENAALLGRVQDTIKKEFQPERVLARTARLLSAKTETVERPHGKPLFEFVGNVGLNLGLTVDQTELLKEETQNAIIEEGGEVKFAFVQGITAVARQMTDYDRRLEVERTGFQLLNDDAGALLKLGREAEKNAAKRKN
jgi:hypothetical protein